MDQAPVQLGQVLAGKYRIERVLGAGGMGVVVAATHLELDERVAVKFLLPEVVSNGEAVARFLQEGRAAVKIRSEHIARVKDVGRLEDGAPYMVMEFLDGQSLGALLRQQGPLPVALVADYLLQAIEAIAEAHALGIVHRDLKPENLFLTRRADGSTCVKVLDFGIAKLLDRGSSGPSAAMTNTTAVLGSPLYMSPEQLTSSKDVDTRADIWSLGVILFELLTGEAPFLGDTMPQLCVSILTAPPRALASLRGGVPRAALAIVDRCLQKSPADRFASVAELAAALAELAPAHARESVERARRVLSSSALSQAQPASAVAARSALGFARTESGVAVPPLVASRPPTRAAAIVGGGLAALVVLGAATMAVVRLASPEGAPVAASAASGPLAAISAAPVEQSPPASPAIVPASSAEPAASASSAPLAKAAPALPLRTGKAPVKKGLGLPEGRK